MKFKNKRNGKVIEEHLIYYINKYKNHPDYEEIKEDKTSSNEYNKKNKEVDK